MYRAPVEEIAFSLKQLAGLDKALAEGTFADLSGDVVDAILSEAGRFATEEVAPLRVVGDRSGSKLVDTGVVATPPGWKELYARWRDGGWNGLGAPAEFGGQGLPLMLSMAALEMWNGASMAFALAPTLTAGAIEAIEAHATPELKDLYLPRLVSGEWTGTMNLTEPQSGSDLSGMRTRAERAPDGSYRIFGQKIFITFGEHDFAGNIVHLVLARLPDAPQGTRGISLFLVPKFIVGEDGTLGRRNDLFCAGLEHKLGIHGSPTCTMIFGDGFVDGADKGAVGYLVGEENRGLACMFTMMNNARLAIGVQGVAIAEAAFQQALGYARERRQGRAAGVSDLVAPIVHHPDVQRMLLTMKSTIQVARALCFQCAHALDRAKLGGDDARHWRERADLLTPIAKSFSTDVGVDVASLGVQVHGGMGFIEETGAAQLYRDARIAPIYEGTNGIQAIDLVTRKLPLSDGAAVRLWIDELEADRAALAASNLDGFGDSAARLADALDDLRAATDALDAFRAAGDSQASLSGATPYLRLFALAAGGAALARAGLAAGEPERIALCRFYAENVLGETGALAARVVSGAPALAAAARHLLEA